MNRPQDSQILKKQGSNNATPPTQKGPTSPRSLYLILYNVISAALWSMVLGRVIMINGTKGYPYAYSDMGDYVRWVQTLAGLEVVHAAIGMTPLPCVGRYLL